MITIHFSLDKKLKVSYRVLERVMIFLANSHRDVIHIHEYKIDPGYCRTGNELASFPIYRDNIIRWLYTYYTTKPLRWVDINRGAINDSR